MLLSYRETRRCSWDYISAPGCVKWDREECEIQLGQKRNWNLVKAGGESSVRWESTILSWKIGALTLWTKSPCPQQEPDCSSDEEML